MGPLRSTRQGLRLVRDHFMAFGVAALAAILAIVLLTGCATPTATDIRTGAGAPATASRSSTGGRTITDGLATIAVDRLPEQARQTLALIAQGGPYPYPRNDDVVYHNRNRVLPKERDGYYHEFTVPTPGLHNRGPRRIIKGAHGELYWTADHYNTFKRIVT